MEVQNNARGKEILINGVILIVLSNEEVENATSSNEKDKYEIPIMTERDIEEFKETQMMY
jgi:hypothetical protein